MVSSVVPLSILAFFRLAPLLLISPIFPFAPIPIFIRTFVTIQFAILIGWLAFISGNFMPITITTVTILSELTIGIFLALSFHAVSAAFQTMFEIINTQTGIAIGSTFDPINSQPTNSFGILISLALTMLFMTSGFLYLFLKGFLHLYEFLPAGKLFLASNQLIGSVAVIFKLAFVICSPIIITLWLLDFALALISKSMPQTQIYFIAIPLKTLLAFLLIGAVINTSEFSLNQIIMQPFIQWTNLVEP